MNLFSRAKRFLGRHWLAATFGVILALTLVGYAPILQKQFLQEDFVQVGIRHFDAQVAAQTGEWLPLAWKWGFVAPVTKRAVIRVLRDWTLWTDYFAWGLNPLGYHLTNLLLHILTSFAVTLLMWRLNKHKASAAFAGVLFAALSIHPEAVADIPSRGHELVTLFMTLTLVFYTRWSSRVARVWAWVCFALALLAVETALTLPLLLILYDLIYQRAAGWKTLAKRQAPFWFILLAYIGARVLLFGGGGGTPSFQHAASWLFFWSGYTQYAADPFSADIALWQVIALNVLYFGALFAYRHRRAVVFGLLWIPVPLLAALAFPPQERYFYPASVGLALALADILRDPLPRWKFSRALGAGAAAALLILYAVSLYRLNENWRNASWLAQNILAQVQALQPTFPNDAEIVFVGLPARARRAPVFSDPLNIQYAIALTYNNPTLRATSAAAFPPFAENPDRTFFFEYNERALAERVDLENQLRQNLACENNISEIAWNFGADTQGWTEWNELANVRVENGVWEMDATGGDPILGSPLINVRGARLDALQIKMRARADHSPLQGEIYWRTRAMDDFSPAFVANFQVIADGALHDYEIKLPVQEDDAIAQLRFDPADAPAHIAIDSIAIVCK